MKKLNRAVHFDFHTMPGVTGFGKDFDAEKFANRLRDANVTYVNVFARCNIGFSYYDTKIGTKYPQMKGDMLKETIQACHNVGIGVTAYLNGGLNHELLLHHPEYMKITKEGEVYRASVAGPNFLKRSGFSQSDYLRISKDGNIYRNDRVNNNFFRTPCFHTGYREYLLSEIKEILSLEPDGIFCDCMMARPCYCPKCIDKMTERGINIENDSAVSKFAYDTIMEVFAEIRSIVPKNKKLYFNSFPYDAIAHYQSHAELECLPTDGLWGYDYFGVYAPYYRCFDSNRVYMTGRFVEGWGDINGVKSKASLENDTYDALLYGYGISIGDHLHPHGTLDEELYQNIGEIFSYVKSVEKWTDEAEVLSDVCVLRNKTYYNTATTDSDKGACRMLAELKICFDVKNEDMDLSSYKLLVLPNNINITEKLTKKLEAFDGCILSCGNSVGSKKIWDYIDVVGKDTSSQSFYTLDGKTVRASYVPCILMKSDYSVATYVDAYFNKVWDGKHGYFYIPSKGETEYSAVAKKGKYAHIGFDVFKSYLNYGADFHKKLVYSLIESLLPERLILADELPSGARASLSQTGDGKLFMVKTTFPEMRGGRGIIEDHVCLPSGRKVKVLGEYRSITTLPKGESVESSICGKYTEITLPEICGFEMFLLK